MPVPHLLIYPIVYNACLKVKPPFTLYIILSKLLAYSIMDGDTQNIYRGEFIFWVRINQFNSDPFSLNQTNNPLSPTLLLIPSCVGVIVSSDGCVLPGTMQQSHSNSCSPRRLEQSTSVIITEYLQV